MAEIKRIGILTSGGDASGMNPAIRSVVRTAIANGLEVVGIREGYQGLMYNNVYEMNPGSVGGIINHGGTILFSARSPEFQTEEGMKKAADNMRYHGIEALVVIGGDGTYKGALDFTSHHPEFPIIGIPGTIDNDIYGTDYTIGYDTAVNVAMEAIDKLRDTATSHGRCFVVEVMGRHAGYIALEVGIASGAEDILIPETPTDLDKIVEELQLAKKRGKKSSIIVVAEGDESGGAMETAKSIEGKTGFDTRVTILGHMQRGGSPTSRERLMAARFGYIAVKALLEGKTNVAVGIWKGEYTYTSLADAVKKVPKIDPVDLELCRTLAI